jgi:hypothetical protein
MSSNKNPQVPAKFGRDLRNNCLRHQTATRRPEKIRLNFSTSSRRLHLDVIAAR